jgi:hypothetical protein
MLICLTEILIYTTKTENVSVLAENVSVLDPPRNFWEAIPKKNLLGASQNCHFIGSPLLTLAG